MCRSPRIDRIVQRVLGTFAFVSGALLITLIVVFLFAGAWPTFQSGLFPRLFADGTWRPGSERDPQYGLMPMLAASVLVTVLATAIAAPIGIAGAVFHRFYLPDRLERWNQRLLELLAGVPSVVFGFWGLVVLVPAINRIAPPGQSVLAAGVVLALMILPMIGLTSQAALRTIPESQLLAAAGLGLGRARTIVQIALPAAKTGIGGGIVLAIARAIGETMAVVMVCGNIARYPSSLFDPVRPVTSTIALEMGYATASHKALLYCAGLVLVVVVGALVGWLAFRRKESPAEAN